MSEKRLFIVAGEASGDMHAARLIRELKNEAPDLRVVGLGGESMRQAGCELIEDLASHAVMGFVQVFRNLGFFRKLFRETVEHMENHRPDVLVLVDYPGFNLRLAAVAKKMGIPVVYYISPQIWAWRPKRIHKIARVVDKMIVILPFEERLYKDANVDVTYVGHPLMDSISEADLDPDFLRGVNIPDPECLVGLLPGSRKQEIDSILPVLLDMAEILLERMPKATFVIPCSNQATMEIVKSLIGDKELPVIPLLGKTYEVAEACRCCIVASGTATLEVACFLTPMVVVYKAGHLLWLLGRRFLRVDHISLVNILAGKGLVPEILQYRMRSDLLADAVVELCRDGEKRENMIVELKNVREQLGSPGASARAAKVVCQALESSDEAPMSVAVS